MLVTREDIAMRAGVSVSAVSRTMNNRGYVAKEKKEAILHAVEELGYRPNPLSNSLKNRQTYQLCFFGSDIYNSFYIELFDYMSSYAMEKGYMMFFFTDFETERVKTMLMDGMIVENDNVANDVRHILGDQFFLPIVSASYGVPIVRTRRIPYVDVDTYDAMEMAISYMRERGHRRIAFATPYDFFYSGNVHPRHICFENVMKPILGKHFGDYIINRPGGDEKRPVFEKENFFEEGMNGADTFVERKCDATAVICFNDEYAMGMMKRFGQLGWRVPDDISILGIDGIQNRKYMTPLLTSVSLNMKEQARCCITTLLDMIEGRKVNYFTSIMPNLVVGESVKNIGKH